MAVRLSESTVKRCANALRQKVTETADGEFLGSEEDLINYFGVSRPTFRQAAKILENESLLTIKRGVGGGFFARRPSMDMVAHLTSVYLNSREANIGHVYQVTWALYIDNAREAARNSNIAARRALGDFILKGHELDTVCESVAAFVELDEKFARRYSELGGNPIMELFLNIVYDYCAETTNLVFDSHPERMREWADARNLLVKHIVDGQPDEAVMAAKKCCNISKVWITKSQREISTSRFRSRPI